VALVGRSGRLNRGNSQSHPPGRTGISGVVVRSQASLSIHRPPVVELLRLTRRSSQWNGSLNRSEFDVQFLEAPEQKRAVPFQPPIARRTVLSL
jgi:hypothetical protein